MKKYFPQWIMFPLWWLFKSPQRNVGWGTLARDLKGLLIAGSAKLIRPSGLGEVSVCVGLKNRSELFLRCFLPSLAKCDHHELIELSVYDCGSTDASLLELEIQKQFKGKVVFFSESHPFSRSFSFNRAVRQATCSRVFLCDADFSLPVNLVRKVNQYTRYGVFWFPVVFYLYKNKPETFVKGHGEWMIWGGKGILACMKSDFLKSGGLDESFTTWGGEDEEYWLRLHASGNIIIRTRESGLLHHWHPSFNPKYKKLEELTDSGRL